jgi:formate dehydrogenase subunit gamma
MSDGAIARARHVEDVAVGDEIVRHRLSSRVIHWAAALFFFATLFTGLPIWTPLFGWMAYLFGGLTVCRWLHPWAGLAFSLSMVVMLVHWLGDMRLTPPDREWLRPARIARYMTTDETDPEGGKYNGGQKLFFFAAVLGALGLLVSGLVLWFPTAFPHIPRALAILLHEVTFILFVVAIVFHVYLGTAAEPGTFRSMVQGTVSRAWARFHHPRWYREVVGDDRRP